MSTILEKTTGSEVDVREVDAEGNALGVDPLAEKALTRRLDIFIMPVLGLLYLMCFLDRGNIGNANVATPSITTALGLTSTQYGACVSVLYATYVVFEPVWANLLKIISPKILLSASATTWGAITLGTAFTKTYHQLIAVRILLGLFEAALFPCIVVYVFMTYRREEVARRMSYIFLCSSMSGAFGGLIAYGLVHIETGKITGWQYLYIVEGVLSLAMAPICLFWLPNDPAKAWFLSAEKREQVSIRYALNKAHYDPDEQFSWKQVGLAMADWKTWVSGIIQFCLDTTVYSMSTFMPAIIKGLGYTNVRAQLLTVPVYFVAAFAFISFALAFERFKMFAPFVLLAQVATLIGYIMVATISSVGGRYAGLCIIAIGLYSSVGLNISWISANTANHYKRSTAFGINQLMGNSAGAAIGFIFTTKRAPRYFTSLYVCIGLTVLGMLATVVMYLGLKLSMRKHERLQAEGAENKPELGDRNPQFRFML